VLLGSAKRICHRLKSSAHSYISPLSLSQVKELDSAPTFLFLPDEGRRRLRHPTQPLQSQLKCWFPLLQSMARIPSCSSPMPPPFGPCALGTVRQALANRYCVALCEEVLAESIKQQLARLLSRFSRTCLAVVLDVRVSPGSFAVHRYLAIGAGPTGARTHYWRQGRNSAVATLAIQQWHGVRGAPDAALTGGEREHGGDG
jgi:hypothetical protein